MAECDAIDFTTRQNDIHSNKEWLSEQSEMSMSLERELVIRITS